MNPSQTFAARNYLIPASGTTHVFVSSGVATANPQYVNFSSFVNSGIPFTPEGAWVDNTQSTSPLVITIQPLDFTITVPAGVLQAVQYPAPSGQTATITGAGAFKIFWCDFPLLPSSSVVTIAGGSVTASLAPGQTVAIPASPAAGLGYSTTSLPAPCAALQGTIAAGATSVTLTPVASTNLRKLRISMTANATLAAAAVDEVTVTLNGVQIFKRGVYIPAAAGASDVVDISESFDEVAFNAGSAGTLVVTLGTALATGQLDVNAVFA